MINNKICTICSKIHNNKSKYCSETCYMLSKKESNRIREIGRTIDKHTKNNYKTLEDLELHFPKTINSFTRIYINSFNLEETWNEMKYKNFKNYNVNNFNKIYPYLEYENIQDIVIYVSNDLKEMKGINIEFCKDKGLYFNVAKFDIYYNSDIKTIKDFFINDDWGYEGINEIGGFDISAINIKKFDEAVNILIKNLK